MRSLRGFLGCATALWIGASIAGAAQAQEFGVSAEFTDYVRRTCGQLAGAGAAARTSTQEDLFRRCNGALNAPADGSGGLTAQGDVLDQYLGVQNVIPQSDGLNRTNRADQFVSARLDVISGQLRGGPSTASFVPTERYMIASASDDIPVPSSAGLSRNGRWDGFFNAGFFNSEQNTTSDEIGYDLDGVWIAGGFDYNVNDKAIVGLALSFVDSSSDISAIGGLSSGGETDSQSWGISAYGATMVTDAIEVNGLVSIGKSDFDTSRQISIVDKNGGGINDVADGNFASIDRVAKSSTEADRYEVAIGASYGHYYDNGVSLTPTVKLSYYHAKIDGFTETDANGLDLTFDEQEVNSTQLTLGATLANPVSMEWGVLMPYARADVIFELQDQEQSVVARYGAALDANDNFVIRTSPAEETVFDIAAGATAQFSNNVALFGEVSSIVGHDDLDHLALTVGLRRAF